MSEFDGAGVRVVACDVFGTTVDWYSGIADQAGAVFREVGVELDGGEFANEWRDMYLPAMQRVREGEREWVYLDTLHRESLDTLLDEHGIGSVLDDAARERLVRAWHLLPAWPDAVEGIGRLRGRYTVAALSNGGFALLTRMIKAAALPFDCIVSAELARSYKPGPRVYRTAAGLLDVDPAQVLMVAAHGWDIDGARAVGNRTAFLERPAEKGPHRKADRGADTVSDVTVGSYIELAELLGC
ncbi:haloacid dehalogenase type II [Nocardia sp. NPDC052566]|uniref:haloacid dehalogenase type II n=1 Tax=Nocardia sp. NPDC052566 TaxID=3364330 RepID=UPI0037C7EDC6